MLRNYCFFLFCSVSYIKKMGAVASVAKKIGDGIEDGVHAVGHVVGTVEHAVVHVAKDGVEDAVHLVKHIPGVGFIVKKGVDAVGDIAPIVSKVSGAVAKFAPILGPEGAEVAKVASSVHNVAETAQKGAGIAKELLHSGGQVGGMLQTYTWKELLEHITQDIGKDANLLTVLLMGKENEHGHAPIIASVAIERNAKQKRHRDLMHEVPSTLVPRKYNAAMWHAPRKS